MSVAELGSVPEPPDDYEYGGSQTDRTPPQDIAAEQSVLGAMMLSKNAIDPAAESCSGDFYRPAHELIFDIIVDSGQPR